MSNRGMGRRTFLKGLAVTALSSAGAASVLKSHAPPGGAAAADESQLIANSEGTNRPKLKAPPNACDSHIHIYDPERFPLAGTQNVAGMTHRGRSFFAPVSEYRRLQARNGTARVVVVTPANYRTDNRCTLDALVQMAPTARGIAVVYPDVTDVELRRLNEGGIRGIRFTVSDPATAITKIDMIEPLSRRVNELGWCVQIHMRGEQILENADMLMRLPSVVVFDHMGRMPQPAGIDYPAFKVILRMIDKGRTWVKLAGAYLNTKIGPPTYADATRIAQAYVKAAPERLVWGSDWPHPTEKEKPNDALLFDLLGEWAPDEKTRRRILVANPEALYGFSSS
ncbi:MAG: amidohydrolase family protein [Candidatus Korobacteraceae bacterium]